nr:hypothetical protein Iba_chr03cCG0780 [Ipomoea batatas]
MEANVPCQPNPLTLDNGEKETLSDASPNLELKDGDIALEVVYGLYSVVERRDL